MRREQPFFLVLCHSADGWAHCGNLVARSADAEWSRRFAAGQHLLRASGAELREDVSNVLEKGATRERSERVRLDTHLIRYLRLRAQSSRRS